MLMMESAVPSHRRDALWDAVSLPASIPKAEKHGTEFCDVFSLSP